MHDKNKDTKSFAELGNYLLKGYFFDCQELYLETNQNSMAVKKKETNNLVFFYILLHNFI